MQYSGVEGASHVLPGVCTALASFFKKDFEKSVSLNVQVIIY